MARRKKKKTKSRIKYLLTLLLACALYFGYEPLANIIQPAPAKVEALPADVLLPAPMEGTPEKILVRQGYTVSYNREHNLPNWVAWELTPEKLVERESRTDKFLPDPDLPEAEAVTTDDYKRSGWDRGHMCPAGDNRWHWRAMQESFYMTNICPQNHNLNRGDWKELEEACREWAQREGKIYIVCGPILYRQRHKTIGREHRITVPEAFFKVVLCPTSNPPRALGFIYKNTTDNHHQSKPIHYECKTGCYLFAKFHDNRQISHNQFLSHYPE